MRLYLDEVGRHSLLSREEEVRLGQAIAAGRATAARLSGDHGLDADEQAALRRVVDAGVQARTTFVDANLRLVVFVARQYQHRGVPLADLIQEGNVGLLKAVERWDWRRGWRFATYAMWWVRQAVSRAVDDGARTIRVPVHTAERARHLGWAANAMAVSSGHEPTARELAEATGTTEADVVLLRRAMREPLSLSSPVGDDEGGELGEILVGDEREPVEEQVGVDAVEDEVRWLLGGLPEREAAVVRALFGIGEPPRTLEEVAARWGFSRERARQIEARAMARLRQAARTRGDRSLLCA